MRSTRTAVNYNNVQGELTLLSKVFANIFACAVDDRTLQFYDFRVCETAGEDWSQVLTIDRDNSKLQDAGAVHQLLKPEDIAKMKADGKTGAEIVAALAQNSATFQAKTQYSQVCLRVCRRQQHSYARQTLGLIAVQAKYKKKKAKKYLTLISTIKPSASSLADFYFTKAPMRTSFLRSDTLAMLLSLANIGAGCRALTVDAVQGLVTGSSHTSLSKLAKQQQCFRQLKAMKQGGALKLRSKANLGIYKACGLQALC